MQIPRSQNMVADEAAKLALLEEGSTSKVLEMEVHKRPNIEEIDRKSVV